MLKPSIFSTFFLISSASLAGTNYPPVDEIPRDPDAITKECKIICEPSSKYCDSLGFIYDDTERDPEKAAEELERICKPWASKGYPPKDCAEICMDIRSEKGKESQTERKKRRKKSESQKTVDYFIDSEGSYNPGGDTVPGMPYDM